MKIFQAGNFNVNKRTDLLYFSIWGVYSKTYQNITYGRWKQLKLCTYHQRDLFDECNAFYEDHCCISNLALKAKGQKFRMPLVHCRINMNRKQYKNLANREYIVTRHNIVVARNTTFEEVSCKVNEYSVSENTLYRYVDGFNNDVISISDIIKYGR